MRKTSSVITFAAISCFAFLIAIVIVNSEKPASKPSNIAVATTTKTEIVTTAKVDLSGFDLNKPAVEYAGPLNAADRILVAKVVEKMSSENEITGRAITDIIYYRLVAPTEFFGRDIEAIVSKPEQFVYDPGCEPTESTLDLVDDELQCILNGTPLVPEGYCHFRLEKDGGMGHIVPFRYESGPIGTPGDEIITYQI